ncbi:IS3 family transposase [Fictibacillus phosphorivorans]|uniref:IS3 family transposase n=1 Tax=Fictibacillus phosphorivorans TaxID=1221500 RepID=UPI002041543C|nr:IS3 family transposase [Fictibacillus phosphorivorans]MCM3774752.1 IS3 family transposase [Fictibacillus phosphorivorans]
MSKIKFDEFQRKQLENNPNVSHVSEQNISYKPEFKEKAVQENLAGKGPMDIFLEHGFDLKMIGPEKPKQCLKRWRRSYEKFGNEVFYTERRGKGSTGRPSSKELTAEEKLKKAEARIAFLEMENGLLKKARRTREAGEEEQALTLSEKFQLIEETIRRFQLKRMVSYLCGIAGVKRKSYYAWLKAEDKRSKREQRDEEDYKLIKQIYDKRNKRDGGREIKMKLENDYGVIMNLKKIFRLTRKFNIQSIIRRKNPYRRLAKATQKHKNCPNVLNRKFVQEPGVVLLTDITYLYLENRTKVYLSCVKDGTTREILAYHLSTSLEMGIVYKTLDNLIMSLDGNVHPEALLHSDQGVHYTHPEYRKRVKELGFTQSMSRKGNCLDNAPIESFFGHFKDEVDATTCKTVAELRGKIEDYMEYYNSARYQWGLKKMTPEQFRGYLLAA